MNDVETIKESFEELKKEDLGIYAFLYHGTTYNKKKTCDFVEIDKINLMKSNPQLDFGKGFYLSPDDSIAKKRANQKVDSFNKASASITSSIEDEGIPLLESQEENFELPIVIKYPFNIDIEVVDNIKVFPYPCKEWLEFIFNNRNNNEITDSDNHNKDLKYNLVYGYMADGLFRRIISLFENTYSNLTDKEVTKIYEVFTRKMEITEKQISLHTLEIISKVLSNGELCEVV